MSGPTDKNNRILEKQKTEPSTMAPSFIKGLTFRVSLGVVLFIGIVIVANYFVTHTKGKQVISEQASKLNKGVGENIILRLKERLSSTETLTKSIARLGLSLPKDKEIFYKVIPEIINQHGMRTLVAGGGVWPAPNSFREGIERRSFFWGRDDQGELQYFDDYNDPEGKGYHNEEWYVPAQFVKDGGVYWSKSYMDPYSLEPMVTCTVPMWDGEVFMGVATIDLRLTGLSDFMSEQAKRIGGYAFALDRNDRLLSFPKSANSDLGAIDRQKYIRNEYPTISELAVLNVGFAPIVSYLKKGEVDLGLALASHDVDATNKLDSIAEQIANGSYQVELDEAKTIARIVTQHLGEPNNSHELYVDMDPVLQEPTSVRILSMREQGWKVVIAMPARYSINFVEDITDTVLSRLLILLLITACIFMLFFNATFLVPVKNLTQQVRRLVSREDYVTRLKTEGQNELAQLANWFNIRTGQLAEALEKIQQRNLQLSEAREVAEQANRSKNIFLASMSHDIRTPMNAIIGMTDVLQKTNLDMEQHRYVNVINSSSQSLLSLINDIMDYSKIEANQLGLEEIPFDLRHVMDDCADLIYFQAAEKRLEFVYYISPDINMNILGDPNRIRQIILNLATNAVKFTSSGRVELWIESIYESDDATQLLIEVRDTGIGLSKSAQQKLFVPFAQGDSTTTRKYGGTGLGLAICKHLAELMGGSIDFRSEEGVGTTFIFKIKLKTEKKKDHRPLFKETLFNDGVLVYGPNHFQNTVIEQYLNNLKIPYRHCETVATWLGEVSNPDTNFNFTICSDICAAMDMESIQMKAADFVKEHRFVLLAAQEELSDLDYDRLPSFREHIDLTLPLKYDHLLRAFSENNDDTEPSSALLSEQGLAFSNFRNLEILVVEDNKVNQQVLLIMLGYLGLTADIANDGVEAIEAVESKNYDIILMDWQMPRMDGLEATRKIRSRLQINYPVIIAVTANAMSGDIDKCLEAGMDDYLSKPIQKDQLEATLLRWLNRQKTQGAKL